jgi:hypothetical protein
MTSLRFWLWRSLTVVAICQPVSVMERVRWRFSSRQAVRLWVLPSMVVEFQFPAPS